MRNGILDLLYSNPHGWGTGPSLQEPEIAYQDDAGNLYGYGGDRVERWTPPSDGMSIYDVATAPAKFSVSLAEALSPYGQEGWQVPPVVQEPINALSRLAENSILPDGSLGIPNPSHPQNQQDVTTGILSMYGGNALNSAMRGGRAALAAAETPDLSLLEAYHAANRLPPVAASGPRPQSGILDHVITGADYAYPAGAHPNFDPPPMADILKAGAANDVPFGPISDVPNVPDAHLNALADQWRADFRPTLSVIDGDLLSDTGTPSLMGSALASGAAHNPKGITAYHGSPHDFDKFSMEHIGKGEGAQAFGHGLYFAESRDVARSYQKELSRAQDKVRYFDGKWYDRNNPAHIAAYYIDRAGDRASALSDLARRKGANFAEAADLIRSGGRIAEITDANIGNGRLYQVRINANPEDFLDIHKPISEQPESIRRALDPLQKRFDEHHNFGKSGARAVVPEDLITPWPEDATNVLRKQDIKGLKYYDQMSRSAGEGTRNYVVFDDSLIDILKKYGMAGAFLAGAQGHSEDDPL